MRRLIIAAIWIGTATAAAAQEQTLINGNVAIHGFGEPSAKYAWINGQSGLLVGGRGGFILNRSLAIGGAGYGLVNEVKGSPYGFDEGPLDLRFGYGGFTAEYIIKPDAVAHFAVSGLVGAGGTFWTHDRRQGFDNNQVGRTDAFFVFEPGLSAEVNLTHGIHLNLGATYRILSGVEQAGLRQDDLSGPSVSFSVKLLGHH